MEASISLGETRFFPTCMGYILSSRDKNLKQIFGHDQGSSLELIEGNLIKFYLPCEAFDKFYLSNSERPEVIDKYKYTNLYYKKKTD